MSRLRLAGAWLVLVLLASCAPRPAPTPTPPPAPPPAPTAPPSPAAPAPLAWEDAPLSFGDWTYVEGSSGSAAAFGPAQAPTFVLRCEPSRQVSLIRAGAASGAALTIRASSGARALPASPRPEGLAASLAAGDPLLDALVFSRGRFAVEAEGQPLLILPAWPEPARVVEDCRS